MTKRRAVVTGGAQGIGRAIVERLLDDGLDVAIWDANADALDAAVQSLPRDRVRGVTCDHAKVGDVAHAFDETNEHLGPVDVLVNNAGVLGPQAALWECPPDEWFRVIEVNLFGMYLCSRVVAPAMAERGWGRIVSMASIAGKEGNPAMSAYSASKAAVMAVTKSLAKEMATTGVLVNAVAPGLVESPMSRSAPEEVKQSLLTKVPMGRLAEAAEVAAMISWLTSDELSYTTGAVFDISGGRATY